MTAQGKVGSWRSEKARLHFVEMEDELALEQWSEPLEAHDVESFAGTTRLYRWRGVGDPIVFLHGSGGTGLSWAPYIQQLTGRDVWAVDTIGDVGRSVQSVPLEDTAALARWLDETFAGAGIGPAHLVGTSYGGYLALARSAHAPDQVVSQTLIDTGGLAPVRKLRFILWGMPMLFGVLAPAPIRRRLARTRPLLEDPRIMRLALHAQRNHVFHLPPAPPLSDDELRSITAPTTVVIASRSAPFEPRASAERARLIPHVEVDWVEGAGHELSWSHVERCLSHVPER